MDMPVSVEVEHWKAPERLPDAAETPWELRVSRRSAGLRVGERPWGAGPTRHGLRVTALARTPRAQAREGTSRGESLGDGSAMMCSEGGSEALEPRPWNQGGGAQATGSPRSFRPRIPQSSRLHRTGDERKQRSSKRSDARRRHGPSVRKSLTSKNPMSGSGPSVSARPEGDQSVEGARNPEDGRRRAGRPETSRSLRRRR
jgi:hypothetical protein